MVKVTGLYGPPSDPAAFGDCYANPRVPPAAKMPDVKRFEATRVLATPGGEQPPYYRIAELWFDSQDTLQQAMGSPEGQETVNDIPKFATGGATVLIGEVD